MKVPKDKPFFEEFMGAYGGTRLARFGVTSGNHRDLFAIKREYSFENLKN